MVKIKLQESKKINERTLQRNNLVYNTRFFAGVAQLVEQLICNQPVAGSSPISSSKEFKGLGVFHLGLFYAWSLSWSLGFRFEYRR